ncbi:MAG: isoprenyl transferase [Parvularculales bacterium]
MGISNAIADYPATLKKECHKDHPSPQPESSASLLQHLAIIMDGNGRWALQRNLPRLAGHRKGIETVKSVVQTAADLDIRYLTLYGFSIENWSRPVMEVNALMGLFRLYLSENLKTLHEKNVRLRIIGERTNLQPDIAELIEKAEEKTRHNNSYFLTIAFNYGGRREIAGAARQIAHAVAKGHLAPENVTESLFGQYMQTVDLPPPDLIVRTSGEQRLSNFLLWQSAYAELMFTDKFWPDFTSDDLIALVGEYQKRERRFGGPSADRGALDDGCL